MTNKQVFRPSPKQADSLLSMLDNESIQILNAGSANAGKSFTSSFFACFSCLNLPGFRVAVGRKFMTSSNISVVKTLTQILKGWSLNISFNSGTHVLAYPNGSTMTLISLEPKDSKDANFTQIQGSEFSLALLDEINEVQEKYYNRLIPRIRYKLEEFDIVPKFLLSCNPIDSGWIMDNWFYDMDNNAVQLKAGQARYLFTPEDNPRKSGALALSMQLADSDTQERFGDGIFRRNRFNDPLAYFNEFSQSVNVERGLKNRILKKYPHHPLHISYDFNALPYVSILISVIDNNGIYTIEEIKAAPPNNTTERSTLLMLEKWGDIIKKNGILIYGDKSGNDKTTKGVTDFQIIKKVIGAHNIKEDKSLSYNGSLKDRRKFMNYLFVNTGKCTNYPGLLIDSNCVELINDCLLGKADVNGLPDKKSHKINGVETRFHLSDALWYLIYGLYPEKLRSYLKELRGGSGGIMQIVTTEAYRNYGGWNY